MKKHYGFFPLFIILFSFYLSNAQTVQWANEGTGEGFDNGNGIATDQSGNVYITGQIEFDATFGSTILESHGIHDILVGKYSTDGQLVWIHSAGGRGGDVGHAIGVDAQNNT